MTLFLPSGTPYLGSKANRGRKAHVTPWTDHLEASEEGWEVVAVAPGERAPVQPAASKLPDKELGVGGRWGQGKGNQRGPELGQAEVTWRPGESLLPTDLGL